MNAGARDAAPPDPGEVATITARRSAVLARIAGACARSGRHASAVGLVAVTKTVAPERIRAGLAAGLTVFGENRVQDASTKIPAVAGATWHLIGPLQTNKTRRAAELFDVIETVDSVELARRLDRLAGELRPGRPLPVLVQVNVDEDPAKAGIDPDALERALPELLALDGIRVDGLMTIGRLVEDPEAARPTFRRLRLLAERLRAAQPRLGPELSMGMSDDFPVAVEEGATIVRIGRAIFGERPAQ